MSRRDDDTTRRSVGEMNRGDSRRGNSRSVSGRVPQGQRTSRRNSTKKEEKEQDSGKRRSGHDIEDIRIDSWINSRHPSEDKRKIVEPDRTGTKERYPDGNKNNAKSGTRVKKKRRLRKERLFGILGFVTFLYAAFNGLSESRADKNASLPPKEKAPETSMQNKRPEPPEATARANTVFEELRKRFGKSTAASRGEIQRDSQVKEPVKKELREEDRKKFVLLTASFEGNKLYQNAVGAFDTGSGSFGLLNWTVSSGNAWKLFETIVKEHEKTGALNEYFKGDELHKQQFIKLFREETQEERKDIQKRNQRIKMQEQWMKDITRKDDKTKFEQPWESRFEGILGNGAVIGKQTEMARQLEQLAVQDMQAFGFNADSAKAFGYMFDWRVQCGKTVINLKDEILQQKEKTEQKMGRQLTEKELMSLILQNSLKMIDPEWREDVQKRKGFYMKGKGDMPVEIHKKIYNPEMLDS